ncbi:hypothetical protein ACFYUY_36230 [Kitasatospora sp. NPDC004745]|uniref:hypothetical protein n=1 Tax=Kitasatospora sp. NPDC004745 TaxID=3364019 RepID=UPI0036802580
MHFHGYEWAGDGRLLTREAERRPVDIIRFGASDLPPMMTGWWLRRPASQVRGTWNTPEAAVLWLTTRYTDHTPGGDPWLPLDARRRYALAQLAGACDVLWSRWISDTRWSGHYVIVCPHRLWTDLPCPAGRPAPATKPAAAPAVPLSRPAPSGRTGPG